MINSEGSGMHADLIAMRITIPPYPVAAITDLMKTKTTARIFSVMNGGRGKNTARTFSNQHFASDRSRLCQDPAEIPQRQWLLSERCFLSEGVTWQRRTLGVLCDFDADSFCVRSRQSRWPQHSILAENFTVQLGYQIIVAVSVVAPNLPELNGFDCHWFFLRRNVPGRPLLRPMPES